MKWGLKFIHGKISTYGISLGKKGTKEIYRSEEEFKNIFFWIRDDINKYKFILNLYWIIIDKGSEKDTSFCLIRNWGFGRF